MPEGAMLATNWWVRGAYEDVKRFDFGGFRFSFGTNEYDSAWAFSWGKLRFALADTNEIVAVSAPMSAVPYCSRLWSAADANGARLVTWENFALNRNTNTPVNAQVELRSMGDFITRSNEVERVCRRVDSDDWDGDGWRNEDDPDPYVWDEYWDSFWQELPDGANSNAYCWVEVRPRWNAEISFDGDASSNLDDPYIWGKAGEIYRVQLLIGKTYEVTGSQPFDIVGRSDPRICVTATWTDAYEIVWPVTFTVAAGRAPSGRRLLGATWNDGGSTFHVLPDPPWLGGAFAWWNYGCCAVTGDGTNFTYSCDNSCTCEGCTAYGCYGYEGYELPLVGLACGCRSVPDEGPAEIVSFGFDKAAAIYEDAYTNRPGEVVYPTPSNAVLRCVVRGGTYGGRLTIAFNEAGRTKIVRVRGNVLPDGVEIAPGVERTFEMEYMPVAPSATINDIIATTTFVENFLGTVHSGTARLTSIKLRMTAVYDAPENHNPTRHIYGVGEEVVFDVLPVSLEILLVTQRYDTADDSCYGYELFGMRERVPVPYASEYRCPVSASKTPPIRVCYEGSEYWPKIKIVEPEKIVTTGASWGENAVDLYYDGDRKCWPYGTVGSAALVTTNYVGPMYVSFQGVAFSEVPCEDEDIVTGCFATNHFRTHVQEAGAGKLHMIYENNFFFVDGARSGAPELDWQPGSAMNWKIPIGWHRIASGYYEGYPLKEADYERCKDRNSRKLLIGGRSDMYMQNRYIDENGTYRTEKFGHWISRSRWCRVILDGHTLQERHVEQ